jgi:hypothetical protein
MSDGGLNIIEPAGTAVTFGGRELVVTPLSVGLIPSFARAIKPISAAVEGVATGQVLLNLETMLDLLAEHGDAIITAVAMAARIPEAELREGDPAELVGLAAVAMKVNADFFAGRLIPALVAAMAARRAADTPGSGPTP